MTRKPLQTGWCKERNPQAEPVSGTPLNFVTKIDIAEPAEPFPTQHAVNGKYMIKKDQSFICRFCRFRRNTLRQNVWEKVPQVPLCPPQWQGKAVRNDL